MTHRLLLFSLTAGLATAGFAQTSNMSPDLQAMMTPQQSVVRNAVAGRAGSSSAGTGINVIIQFKQAPTSVQHQMVQNAGGALVTQLGSSNTAMYSVPASGLPAIAGDPSVAYISPDRSVHAFLDLTDAAVNATAARASFGYNGSGIGVAVIDSGVARHPDLSDRVVDSEDFTSANTGNDDYGHGTHVAGILASNGHSSAGPQYTRTFHGIASGVKIVSLRVLDAKGNGTDSAVISAIQRAIALKSTYNIRVINLSLGRPVFETYTLDPLCQAVEAAWKAGIVVVVAAGNGGRDNSQNTAGYDTITAPGNDPYAITVGAMKTMGTPQRSDDLIASYSSKGPTLLDHVVKPDLVAPGNLVVSLMAANSQLATAYPQTLVPLSYYMNAAGTGKSAAYFRLNGTSMATAVVSGAAALLLQKTPRLTPDQVKARLMKTAGKTFPVSSVATDPTTGQTYTD